VGTTIVASAGGTVVLAKLSGWNGGYGGLTIIQHDNGSQTLYAHQSKITVASGQKVSQGQKIGEVGNTGRSSGPHLHLEFRGIKNPDLY
jgi:murein DD-endopeptidase MepM/ murein hydrolase activator NlpD